MAFRSLGAGPGARPRLRASSRWLLTIVATGISIYVLDVVATLAGVALVASGLLRRLDLVWVVLLLAGTYVVWAFGLHANLDANWSLLERTGTSTNCLSKAAYDVARLGAKSDGACRLASDGGYVVVELVKEAPYYAAAFGAAAISEAITSNDALVFLSGANVGAACYEFGLARVTKAWLGPADAPAARSDAP